MKRIFYYTTTALVLSCGITQAQTCVPTPTCSSLGYTSSTACDGGLKCPFGEAWYCPSGGSQDMTELCSLMGYTRTCTDSNQTGGSGQTCGGLYKDCSCKSGYKWDNGACINPCSSPYVWNGSSCVCASYYKYSCNGSYQTGGSGVSCNGKYASCNCSYPYEWSSSQCKTTAVNTCTGEHETGGIGIAYNGKYVSCNCEAGYSWCGYGTSKGFCIGLGNNCM